MSAQLELLQSFAENRLAFAAFFSEKSEEDIQKMPEDGEWSLAYIAHHMADADTYFATRFMSILAEENPKIYPFDEDAFPARLNYFYRDARTSVALIISITSAMTEILSNLPDEAWQRSGEHAARGPMTLQSMVELSSKHMSDHLEHARSTWEKVAG